MLISKYENFVFIQSLESSIFVVAAYTVDVLGRYSREERWLFQVTADDADIGVNDDLTFSIVSGDPASEFEIQNGT